MTITSATETPLRVVDAMRGMKLNPSEEHDMLCFLCGYEPEAVLAALEQIAKWRKS